MSSLGFGMFDWLLMPGGLSNATKTPAEMNVLFPSPASIGMGDVRFEEFGLTAVDIARDKAGVPTTSSDASGIVKVVLVVVGALVVLGLVSK